MAGEVIFSPAAKLFSFVQWGGKEKNKKAFSSSFPFRLYFEKKHKQKRVQKAKMEKKLPKNDFWRRRDQVKSIPIRYGQTPSPSFHWLSTCRKI